MYHSRYRIKKFFFSLSKFSYFCKTYKKFFNLEDDDKIFVTKMIKTKYPKKSVMYCINGQSKQFLENLETAHKKQEEQLLTIKNNTIALMSSFNDSSLCDKNAKGEVIINQTNAKNLIENIKEKLNEKYSELEKSRKETQKDSTNQQYDHVMSYLGKAANSLRLWLNYLSDNISDDNFNNLIKKVYRVLHDLNIQMNKSSSKESIYFCEWLDSYLDEIKSIRPSKDKLTKDLQKK